MRSESMEKHRFNHGLVHQVVVSMLTNLRSGTKAQKTRAMVSGGGSKPWKQKGTGRARAGSIRSPIWKGGGKVFAATPKQYNLKVNRKMYQKALAQVMRNFMVASRMLTVDNYVAATPKTKDFLAYLAKIKLPDVSEKKNKTFRTLYVVEEINPNLILATRNLPNFLVIATSELEPIVLLESDVVLVDAHTHSYIQDYINEKDSPVI